MIPALRRLALVAGLALAAQTAPAAVEVGPPDAAFKSMLEAATGNVFMVPRVVIRVTGEITPEDATAVKAELDTFWENPRNRFQEGVQVVAVLDSPGGNFKAGIEIARQFQEKGVTTLVPPGGACLSACAVAFMAGWHVSMGGEGSISRSRMVIMPAELGFHRPFLAEVGGLSISPNVMTSLSPEELGAFFADRFTQSFDAANALLQEMLAVDPDAWNPDLLLKMLTARQGGPDGGFIRLETVRDALTWDIAVPNVPPPPMATARDRFEAAFAFCFNVGPTLTSSASGFWEGGPDLEETYAFNRRGGHGQSSEPGAPRWIYIHHESPMGCVVNDSGGRLEMKVGQFAENDPLVRLEIPLAGYHPDRLLRDIATRAGPVAAFRCMVLNGNRVIDDEPCRLESGRGADNEIVHTFIWPSGSRTVLQHQGARVLLNGSAIGPFVSPVDGMDACYTSEQTGATFCHGES